MTYNWDLMRGLLREIQRLGSEHFKPRQFAEAFAVEQEDAGVPVPDLDALRGEAAAYEGHLVNGEFIVPRPEDDGESYQLTERGQRLLALLEQPQQAAIRQHLEDKGTAAMLPEVFDELQASLP